MPHLTEITSDLQSVEAEAALFEAVNFNARANAVDFIDFHIIDSIEAMLQTADQPNQLHILKQQAMHLKHGLEQVDKKMFRRLRNDIRSGACNGQAFAQVVLSHTGYDFVATAPSESIGYDNLDNFINGLLLGPTIPALSAALQPDMVFYQQTPARVIFELAHKAKLQPYDVFVDIGAGLGLVALLVSLISGAKTKGIEYDSAYCGYATACAEQLNLVNVEFINVDALTANHSDGTVFFLYTPFKGSMLLDMLEILRLEAQNRAIRVFSYGPCSPIVSAQDWLYARNGEGEDHYKLYEFTSI